MTLDRAPFLAFQLLLCSFLQLIATDCWVITPVGISGKIRSPSSLCSVDFGTASPLYFLGFSWTCFFVFFFNKEQFIDACGQFLICSTLSLRCRYQRSGNKKCFRKRCEPPELASLILFSEHLVCPFQPGKHFMRFNWFCLLSIKKDLFLEQPEQGEGDN